MTVSTHVLDTVSGRPAPGVPVELARQQGRGWTTLARALTDGDGRVASFEPAETAGAAAPGAPGRPDDGDDGHLGIGLYRLTFETAGHVAGARFFPQVVIVFRIQDPDGHYHVPVQLSPFAFSAYRGS